MTEYAFDEDAYVLSRLAEQLRVNLEGVTGAGETAKGIYSAVRQAAALYGHNPDIETFMRTPEQSLASGHPHGNCYVISWEAGPYAWVHKAWPIVMDLTGRLCEPYHSFDLCIYEQE